MKRLPESTWREIRTAHASGCPLRELARNMGIPAGTILARSKRENWTRRNAEAKALVPASPAGAAITAMQSAAMSLEARAQRHCERIAGVTERGVDHVEGMDGATILDRVGDLEKLDRVARRTFGLDKGERQTGAINIALIMTELPDLPAHAREV